MLKMRYFRRKACGQMLKLRLREDIELALKIIMVISLNNGSKL